MRRARWVGAWVAAALAFAMVLAACSSSGSKSSSSSSGGAAASGPTLLIGVNDAEGTPYNNSPERVAAVKAAVQGLNGSTRAGGKTYKVDYCNDGNTVNTGLACARQFITDKVIACVGCESDFANAQVATLLKGAGIPMIEDEAETPEEFNGENMFLLSGGAQFQVAGTVVQAHNLGVTKWFFAGIDFPGTQAYVDVAKQVSDKLGMTFAGSVLMPADVANYDSYAAKAKASGATAVIEIMSPQWYIPMTNAMTALGYNPMIMLNGDVPRPQDFPQLGAASSRTYVSADVPPPSSASSNADVKTFVDDLAAYGKSSGDKGADLQGMRLSAVRAWLGMKFLADLVAPMKGDVTAATVTDALKAAKDLKSTMIQPWTPNATGCVKGYSRVSNPYVFFLKVVNNQMVLGDADKTPTDMTKYLC